MRILRVVGSRVLDCGCFVGTYELYDASTIEVVDEVADTCQAGPHRLNAVLAHHGRAFDLDPASHSEEHHLAG